MSDTKRWNDETTVTHGDVVVRRELTSKAEGIVGEIEIRSQRDEPVLVHVVDEFRSDLPVESAAFRPDCDPDGGSITPERASIVQPVEAEPITVEYGIKLPGPVGEVQFDDPTIRGVEAATSTRSAAPMSDGGEQSPGGTASEETESASILGRLTRLDRRESSADGGDATPDAGQDVAQDAAQGATPDPDEGSGTDPPGAAPATDDPAGASERLVEQAVAEVQDDGANQATDETADDDGPVPDEATDGDAEH